MKPTESPFNPAAEEQASLWAARLDGSVLSSRDRLELDAWLAQDPAHRELLSNFCQFSADLEKKLPQLSSAHAVDFAPAAPRRSSRRRWVALGGLAAAAAVAVVFWADFGPSVSSDNIVTPVGRRQSLTLADGTLVDLNARTSLRVEISGDRRHVVLAFGEAYFAVHKDPSRPFVVDTPAGSVRVTGTHFDVRTESTSTLEVTVAEGSVEARPNDRGGAPAALHALAAGDQLSASSGDVAVRRLSPSALEDALAWRQGQVVFDGVPLREALARFARYHGRTLTVSPDVAQKSVGGRHSLDDLEGFLSFIEEGLQLRVTREPNGAVRVSARPAP
ncbi:MAG: fec operon regulator FecR [Verrucomicrobia bacterium]|nr:fec operon regulator FecR [Verrucomicrobiota bacterium]